MSGQKIIDGLKEALEHASGAPQDELGVLIEQMRVAVADRDAAPWDYDEELTETYRQAMTALTSLIAERDAARQIVRDTHWMAVRYADGRQSYAVGMCNDALRKAYEDGWLSYAEFRQHDLDPQYARDGSKPEYRHIEERALAAEAQLKAAREALEPFAEAAEGTDANDDYSSASIWEHSCALDITIGDLRRARTALSLDTNKGDGV